MEAIVLAGGFGTRLRHIISDVPKPMAPINHQPFLRFVFDMLTTQGIDRIVVATGYMHEKIEEAFGTSYRGAKLLYSREDKPLLTGGAVKKALDLCRDERVYIVNGDTYFEVDLLQMQEQMCIHKADFVIAAKHLQNFDRYGRLELKEDGQVVAFLEKQSTLDGMINGGVYLMKRSFLDSESRVCFSLEKDVMEIDTVNRNIFAYPFDGYFIDIGVPDDYARAQQTLKQYDVKQKAVFFDRDGTINVDVHYLHKPEDLVLINGMPEFMRKWKEWGYKVIVLTNQAGIARGYYSEEEMSALHRYMNLRLAEYGAHIDAFYFCPHHPDITGPCHCRKPETGMLEQAIKDFNLEPNDCLLFGDKIWDVETGERCGVKSVLITENY